VSSRRGCRGTTRTAMRMRKFDGPSFDPIGSANRPSTHRQPCSLPGAQEAGGIGVPQLEHSRKLVCPHVQFDRAPTSKSFTPSNEREVLRPLRCKHLFRLSSIPIARDSSRHVNHTDVKVVPFVQFQDARRCSIGSHDRSVMGGKN
jgi:hypothetical protein